MLPEKSGRVGCSGGSSGQARVPGPQGSALSGRCCRPWWSGPCWPSGDSGGSVKAGRECGQGGAYRPPGRCSRHLGSPSLGPRGQSKRPAPHPQLCRRGPTSAASANLLTARGAARSRAQGASHCQRPGGYHGCWGLQTETALEAGVRGRRGVQVGRGDPERRPLCLGFTEGRARCGGGKEALEASRTAPGVPGGLLASLPRPGLPPPPAVPRGGQGRASGGSACSSELAISGRRLAFQNAILSSYKSRPGRHGHRASLRMQGRPEAQPRRGRGGGARRAPTPAGAPDPHSAGLAPGEVGPSASAESAQSREEDVFPVRVTRALPVSSCNLTLDCCPEAGRGPLISPPRHAGPVVWLTFAGSSRRDVRLVREPQAQIDVRFPAGRSVTWSFEAHNDSRPSAQVSGYKC